MDFEPVIGLEIHAQLATKSKIFSSASTSYGAPPNTQACAVDLGLPGVLPVLNERVIELAIMFGLAVGADISRDSLFARKNYFYPDLPKGYQISQYENPIVAGGTLDIRLSDGTAKTIALTRAHLEEDAGKSIHDLFPDATGVDLNRAGTPLLEIVSEPQMYSAAEAVAYMRTMHTLVRYLGICDGNMQEGSFRCDANVSVRPRGTVELGTRTEIKNLNSFRFVERAIEFEIERQIDVIEAGGTIVQETRLYDPDKDETRSMRGKEDAHDYRYFPDPDLLPIVISQAVIDDISARMPELPGARRKRFIDAYSLGPEDADSLSQDRDTADYFERVADTAGDAKLAANWVTGELFAALNRSNLDLGASPLGAESLGRLLARIKDATVSGKIAKQIFETMWETGREADDIIDAEGLRQVTDDAAIEPLVDQVLRDNPDQIAQFKAGKDKVFGFFVGQVMKLSKGKANPAQVNEMLKRKLAE
jgi:aspartyl-tRNA(Asn)/glutamyl-tRNA(Gln) amidotransferase subunit B